MAEYFIGIDGGGTKSKLVLVDEKLNILYEHIGIGTNLLSVGINNAAKTFFELIKNAVKSTNIAISQIKGITIGTAGAGRNEQVKSLMNKLLIILQSKKYPVENLIITSDAEITLKGAFPNGKGIILIAGTGSILYGKDDDGKIFQIGGMGKLIGDEGSGYSIGKKGLSVISKIFDGREKSTLLFEVFKKKFDIKTQPEMIDIVYSKNFSIAKFAETVIETASQGDEFSLSILDEEAEELLKHIVTAINQLKSNKLNLTLSGSLLVTENYYCEILKRKLAKLSGKINLCQPRFSSEIGAALLSIENFIR